MYLYEHKDWSRFTWDDREVTPLLTAVRFAQGRLLGRVADLGFSVTQTAELDALTDEVITSSGIEGVELDARSVRSSVARQLGVDYPQAVGDTHAVDGAVQMTLDATMRFAEPLTASRLCGWQAALFPTGRSGMHEITVGAWRHDVMQVVSGGHGSERVHYQAPAPEQVPGLMADFLDWFESKRVLDDVLRAGLAHLWFLTIHPFDDGNGRVARALTELALARSDGSPRRFYTMSSAILADRSAYYQVLEQTQKGGRDVTAWLVWFLSTLLDALQDSEQKLAAVLARATFWQRLEGVALSERQRFMLTRLLGDFEGKLTSAKWAKMTKVSQDTATRDINDLVDKGVLARDAGGRSTSYRVVGLVAN